MSTETLTAPSPASDQASRQADAAAPAAPRAGEPGRETQGNKPEGQDGAARNPEALRQARLDAARAVRTSRSAGAQDGGPRGQAAGGAPKADATTNPQTGTPSPAQPAAPNAPGEGERPETGPLKYGTHTAKDKAELEKLMSAGMRARLEMGALGEKIAQGQPLTVAELGELLAHFDKRNQGMNQKLAELRAKAPNGPADPAQNGGAKQQPQTKPGGRGQTPAGSSNSGSPETDALDEDALLELDDAAAGRIRGAFQARGQRLSELEAQVTAQRQTLGDLHFAMAVGAVASTRPELRTKLADPATQTAILDQLEKWNVTDDAMSAGGPDFLHAVQQAATLVLLPSATEAHADLLARSAAEMAGSPRQPITSRSAPKMPATMTRQQARLEIAKVTSDSTLTPVEKELRLDAIRSAFQAGQQKAAAAPQQ